jgi:hypothetical protein
MAVVAAAVCFSGCKVARPLEWLNQNGGSGDSVSDLSASSVDEVDQKDRYFKSFFGKSYERKLQSLPKEGVVTKERVPYSGGWYPQANQGTARNFGTGSPLTKYDQAFHRAASKAQAWELQNHSLAVGHPNRDWAGHCNGFSSAASRHSEPKNPVTVGSVTFTPKDIKALLAEIYMSTKFLFLGGNRCALGHMARLPSPLSRQDSLQMAECEDVNPGTFHIAVANWIGIQKYPVIMDVSSTGQVWNYPHFSFASAYRFVSAADAMQQIAGIQSTYRFNPRAKSFAAVTTNILYANAFEREVLQTESIAEKRTNSSTYQYILELDEKGVIIGGEWIGTSQQSHPDFIWIALEPVQSTGSQYEGNPHLDPNEVIKLWAKSVGIDPNNIPKGLTEPTTGLQWGSFLSFEVSLNNRDIPFIPLTNEISTFTLTTRNAVLDQASPEIVMLGKNLPVQRLENGFVANIEPSILKRGYWPIQIKWVKENKTLIEESLFVTIL